MTSEEKKADVRRLGNLRGILFISLAVLCFAVLDTLSKYLAQFYPVPLLLWGRYLVHVIILAAIFGPKIGFGLVRTGQPVFQILRAVFLLAAGLLMITGFRYLPLAEATAIAFAAPLIVSALSGPLLGEVAKRRDWVAVAIGFAGVLIIVRPGGTLLTFAALLPLGTAVCNAMYQVMTRKFRGSESPITTNFITGVVGTVLTSLTLPFVWQMPALIHIPLMIAMGIFGVTRHFLLIKAFSRAAPAVLSPFTYGQLLWAALLGFVAFGALPDHGSILGMLVIAASGLFVTYDYFFQQRKHA